MWEMGDTGTDSFTGSTQRSQLQVFHINNSSLWLIFWVDCESTFVSRLWTGNNQINQKETYECAKTLSWVKSAKVPPVHMENLHFDLHIVWLAWSILYYQLYRTNLQHLANYIQHFQNQIN